jgi:hypothetical protein
VNTRFFYADDALVEELATLIFKRALIPVFGSGLTGGCKAHNGVVPTGKALCTDFRKRLSSEISGDLSARNFQEITSIYDKIIPLEEKQQYYIDRFTDVEVSPEVLNFLKLPWRLIYTLNVDDAIELATGYKPILPRKNYCEQYINEFDIVFKIHGDVHAFLVGDEPLIFNRKEYLDSLMTNGKMLSKFKTDFLDNNVIFIGCSLTDELDLLSVISDTLKIKSGFRNVYYLSGSDADDAEKLLLEDYGITEFIVCNDFPEFYSKVSRLATAKTNPHISMLDFCREPKTQTIPATLDVMVNSNNLVPIPFNGEFFKPAFFFSREVTRSILESLVNTAPIHLIYGHRVSGKTYCLFDIYSSVHNKTRYFFPSGTALDDEAIGTIIRSKNSFYAFDTECLTTNQIYSIIRSREFTRNGNLAVIAVNTSDRYVHDLLIDPRDYATTEILNFFNWREELSINTLLQKNSIPTLLFKEYRSDRSKPIYHTLLDNLCKIANVFFAGSSSYSLPKLEGVTKEELEVYLILATNQSADSYDMYYFDIMYECSKIVEKNPRFFELVYFEGIPTYRRESKFKLITNIRFYLLKMLGDFASDAKNRQIISDAYAYIYEQIAQNETGYEVSRKMLDYIKCDVINDVFYQRNQGVVSLIKHVYQSLEEKLNTNPQFKHQRAKTILWLERDNLSEVRQAREYIKVSVYDLDNDCKARLYPNQNLKYALSHARYTQAIILGRICALEEYTNTNSMLDALIAYNTALIDANNCQELEKLQDARKQRERLIAKDLKTLLAKCCDLSLSTQDLYQRATEIRATLKL